MTSPVLILTGGPGCGKTHTTAMIVKLWEAIGKNLSLAAPTGKASQRLQEVVQLDTSSTVHRLLQYRAAGSMKDKDDEEALEGSYAFCRSNPLPANAVLVDEASMLDITLTAALLEALAPKTQLVLVGDVDQLPPVGPGTVLSAAIESKAIPVVDLREIFRQARESNIVRAAHSVQRGAFPELTEVSPQLLQSDYQSWPDEATESDAVWFRPDKKADGGGLQDLLVDVLIDFVAPQGFDLQRDVQVLSPMRQGVAGVEPMNKRLQALLNPPRSDAPQVDRHATARQSMVFRQGDRVIQTINNYDREVYNGDSGFVVQVDPINRNLSVEFPETDYQRIKEGFKTKIVDYKGSHFGELDLAWVTTVHKAQGGESRAVVLVLSDSHRLLLNRRLLYTALTRAKDLVVVIGPEKAIATAVKEAEGEKRLSTLKDRIQAQAVRLSLPCRDAQVYGPAAAVNPIDVSASSPLSEAKKEGAKVKAPSTKAIGQTASADSGRGARIADGGIGGTRPAPPPTTPRHKAKSAQYVQSEPSNAILEDPLKGPARPIAPLEHRAASETVNQGQAARQTAGRRAPNMNNGRPRNQPPMRQSPWAANALTKASASQSMARGRPFSAGQTPREAGSTHVSRNQTPDAAQAQSVKERQQGSKDGPGQSTRHNSPHQPAQREESPALETPDNAAASGDRSQGGGQEYSEEHWMKDAKSLGQQKASRVAWEESTFWGARST